MATAGGALVTDEPDEDRMDHPRTSDVRLTGRVSRLYRKFFRPEDPLGWADYHTVRERRGTLWVHCHGLRRSLGAELEFVAVPHDLRDVAQDLLIELIRHLRQGHAVAADTDFEARLLSPGQSFAHLASFRTAPRSDRRHTGMLRVVDRGEPMQSGFPVRLFAAHLTARAEAESRRRRKEGLYRKAIEIFPGDFADDREGADFDPAAPVLTSLQYRSNLAAYLGLAEFLRAQRRVGEAAGCLEAAIARCPGWARVYREYLLLTYRADDPYLRYWKDADVGRIVLRRRAEAEAAAPAAVAPGPVRRAGFGRRPRGVADFLSS